MYSWRRVCSWLSKLGADRYCILLQCGNEQALWIYLCRFEWLGRRQRQTFKKGFLLLVRTCHRDQRGCFIACTAGRYCSRNVCCMKHDVWTYGFLMKKNQYAWNLHTDFLSVSWIGAVQYLIEEKLMIYDLTDAFQLFSCAYRKQEYSCVWIKLQDSSVLLSYNLSNSRASLDRSCTHLPLSIRRHSFVWIPLRLLLTVADLPAAALWNMQYSCG